MHVFLCVSTKTLPGISVPMGAYPGHYGIIIIYHCCTVCTIIFVSKLYYVDLPATQRIPDNPRRARPTTTTTPKTTPTTAPPPPATAAAATRRPATAAPINTTYTDQHRTRTRQSCPAQRRLNNVTGGGGGVRRDKRENPWHKCLHYFYILC